MRVETKTTRQHREDIRRMAAESLARHKIEDVGTAGDTRVFRFREPGSTFYAVRIVCWPGWVVVAGDAGDTLFRHSDRVTLAWLRGAAGDVAYMLGKVQGARKVFSVGDAMQFLDELAASDATRATLVREAWSPIDDGPDEFYRACRDADVDDPPLCQEYESDHVWAVEILRHFVAAFIADEKAKQDRERDAAGRSACPSCTATPGAPCVTGGTTEPPGVYHLSRTMFGQELIALCGCGPINLTGAPHADTCPARDGGVALLAQRAAEAAATRTTAAPAPRPTADAIAEALVREWSPEGHGTLLRLKERIAAAIDADRAGRVPTGTPGTYLLRSGITGDCVLWWKAGDAGYTMNVDQAARYTAEEVRRRARPGVDHVVTEADALRAAVRHVDAERMARPTCVACGGTIADFMHYTVEARGLCHATPENCKDRE